MLGVGLFLSYTRPPFVLYGTLWILLLAFLTLELPAAYQQMQSAFSAIHPELEDASRILGATRLRALREITAPLLRTSVIATWCFVFVGTIRELSAAIMLFTSETKVISVLIFDLNESGDLAAISVLGIIMLVVTFAHRRAGQPAAPRRRQRAAAGQLSHSTWTASSLPGTICRWLPSNLAHDARSQIHPTPDIAVAEHLADDRASMPQAAAAREQMRGDADRRGRPLRRRAQRGLRRQRARRLGRRRALHRDRPRARA